MAELELPLVAVVIPTIPGREELLEATERAYRNLAGVRVRLLVVNGAPTIGQAWEAGRRAAAELDEVPRWIHLSADDVVPAHRALEAAVARAAEGIYPSPRILNPDGTLHSCGTLGAGMMLPEVADRSPAGASPFPLFAAEVLAGIPTIPPIHYYADDWLGYFARRAGLRVEVCRPMELLHLEGTVGRERVAARAMADRAVCLASMAELEDELDGAGASYGRSSAGARP